MADVCVVVTAPFTVAASRDVYTLGFYLDESERGKSFHRLTVKVDLPGLELHYRLGYYPNGEEGLAVLHKRAPIESTLLDPADSTDVGITVFLDAVTQRGKLRARLNLDPGTLSIEQLRNLRSDKVDDWIVQFNDGGRRLAKLSDTHEFRLPVTARPKFETRGLPLDQEIQLAEGATRLAVIVRDCASDGSALSLCRFSISSRSKAADPITKDSLYHVPPRTAGRSEAHVDERAPLQPALHFGVFVRSIVIRDEMKVFAPVVAHADDCIVRGVQGGKS